MKKYLFRNRSLSDICINPPSLDAIPKRTIAHGECFYGSDIHKFMLEGQVIIIKEIIEANVLTQVEFVNGEIKDVSKNALLLLKNVSPHDLILPYINKKTRTNLIRSMEEFEGTYSTYIVYKSHVKILKVIEDTAQSDVANRIYKFNEVSQNDKKQYLEEKYWRISTFAKEFDIQEAKLNKFIQSGFMKNLEKFNNTTYFPKDENADLQAIYNNRKEYLQNHHLKNQKMMSEEFQRSEYVIQKLCRDGMIKGAYYDDYALEYVMPCDATCNGINDPNLSELARELGVKPPYISRLRKNNLIPGTYSTSNSERKGWSETVFIKREEYDKFVKNYKAKTHVRKNKAKFVRRNVKKIMESKGFDTNVLSYLLTDSNTYPINNEKYVYIGEYSKLTGLSRDFIMRNIEDNTMPWASKDKLGKTTILLPVDTFKSLQYTYTPAYFTIENYSKTTGIHKKKVRRDILSGKTKNCIKTKLKYYIPLSPDEKHICKISEIYNIEQYSGFSRLSTKEIMALINLKEPIPHEYFIYDDQYYFIIKSVEQL